MRVGMYVCLFVPFLLRKKQKGAVKPAALTGVGWHHLTC